MEPGAAGFWPVHWAREKPTRLPKTEPARLSVTVTGRPDWKTVRPDNCQFERIWRTVRGAERHVGGRYVKLATKRCLRSKSDGPRELRGSVWSPPRKLRS